MSTIPPQFAGQLAADGDWTIAGSGGSLKATDASGKYPPVFLSPRGTLSSRTTPGLQPAPKADHA